MTEVEEPPRLVRALRQWVDEVCADRTDLRVEHGFVDEPGSYGLNTVVSPVGQGSEVWFWYDGFDEDLMLLVEDEYYFEWLADAVADETAVVADVRGIMSAVLAGDSRVRRAGRRRQLDVWTSDGRHWTGTGHRTSLLRRSPRGLALDERLPGHGPDARG